MSLSPVKNTEETPYIVVNDDDVQVGRIGIGCITQWELGTETDHAELVRVWTKLGLNSDYPVPPIPNEHVIMRRAVEARAKGDILCRPRKLKGEGLELVQVKRVEGRANDYDLQVTIKLGKAGRPQYAPSYSEYRDLIDTDFDRLALVATNSDISGWLVGLVKEKLSGVALRDSGGTYFLPSKSIRVWERMNMALRSVNVDHRIYRIPAMRTQSAIEAILASLRNEAETASKQLEEDLSKAGTEVGARALTSRANEAFETAKKIREYESFLGAQVEGLAETMDSLRERLTAAAVVAEQQRRKQQAA